MVKLIQDKTHFERICGNCRRLIIELVHNIALTLGKRGHVAKILWVFTAAADKFLATTLTPDVDIFD